ncbi:hypothetical protein BZA77DRAFT_355644 [Pyronema omphalodes]|nr:hypothetical protein BZA77DRAFT_355644 [Pyronema omphalodes]
MPSQNNSSPGMLPRPPIWFGSPSDEMDLDAPVPQQQPPPQQMNGFFQGFVQASGGPQSAIPADVQYSRNSDPATTPDRQSPIDNMAAPMDILLGSLQRMNISPGDLSGEPSGLHNEMPANIQNIPAAHVPPVSTFNVADTAMGDTTSKTSSMARNGKVLIYDASRYGDLNERYVDFEKIGYFEGFKAVLTDQ